MCACLFYLHGREEKYIVAFLFDDALGIEGIGQKKPSIINEFRAHSFIHQEVIFHDYQDRFVSLFYSSVKVEFLSFINLGYAFNFCYLLSIDGRLRNSQAPLMLDHLFDSLYWRFHIT